MTRQERIEAACRQVLSKDEMRHLLIFAVRAPCDRCFILLEAVRRRFAII